MTKAPSKIAFLAKLFLEMSAVGGLLGLAVLAVTNFWIVTKAEPQIVDGQPVEVRDYAIVLGAGVRGQALSGALKSRMMRAMQLYQNKTVRKILVSGDGTDPYYNETVAMKKFAIKNEIPAADIESDALGFSTYDSVLRAREVFKIRNAYVVSQNFHLTRILWLANAVGIDALGVPAGPVDEEWYYRMREVPARTKDFFLHWADYRPEGTRDKFF